MKETTKKFTRRNVGNLLAVLGAMFLAPCLQAAPGQVNPSAAPAAAANFAEVMVQGDNVNLRAKATNNCEVVVQKNFGDVLLAKSLGDEWVEIVPPKGTVFWVFGDYLKENVVKASTLNVRAGPSGNYNIVGQLKRHDAVTRVEEKGDWVGIAPTEAMSLFVHRDLVKLKEVPKPAPAVNPPANPPVSPPVEVAVQPQQPRPPMQRPAPPPVVRRADGPIPGVKPVQPIAVEPTRIPVPDHLKLLPVSSQGQVAKRRGVIGSYLFAGNSPSRYYLAIHAEGGRKKVCYLDETKGPLKQYKGQAVIIDGWDYWVQGQTLPLMVVDTIQVVP